MNLHLSRRDFLTTLTASAAIALPWRDRTLNADENDSMSYDVIVVGGTPGGIAAAVSAARLRRRVVLVERHHHLGGMTSSGLGKSDIEHREMIQGIFAEFIGRVRQHYVETYGTDSEDFALCRDGYYFEPSVAEAVFDQLVAEQPTLTVMRGHQLESVLQESGTVQGVIVRNRRTDELITYASSRRDRCNLRGDVYAGAGAKFRLGRESRDTFDEPHAGVVYFDYQNQKFLEGTTGDEVRSYQPTRTGSA
ncbi:MAG: FAD-dependent oxidoreductase [Planctomycetaceae bacterium]